MTDHFPSTEEEQPMSQYTLLAIHAEDGITEFTAPGASIDDAVNSEQAKEVEDKLQREYGTEPECVILPASAPPEHPLVELVDGQLDGVDLQNELSQRDGTGSGGL